jgi:SAM-dependent methyltransferase
MTVAGSPSIEKPDYWWYRARSELLERAFLEYVGDAERVLDIGSADGPSVSWLAAQRQRVALDLDPRGLRQGDVCGSALALPFADGAFDVVAAFDVIEHCDPESQAVAEVARILKPGGRFLMSVPAYKWAWTHFDEWNNHHRRYTRRRAVAAVESGGLVVRRATYAFAGTFPFFAAQRLSTRLKERGRPAGALGQDDVPPLPEVSPAIGTMLHSLSMLDGRILTSGRNLPFGSSVLVAAEKPIAPALGS